MDFQSAMETFAEAWVAANTKAGPLVDTSQSQALALTRNCKSPLSIGAAMCQSSCEQREKSERNTHTPAPVMSVTPHADTESVVSPPSVKEEFDKTSSGKSLPVHCVVEAICSLEETRGNHTGQWRRRPIIETDSFVIIPTSTPFQELVQAALQRLGYPTECAAAAKGSVIMKNWKPLSFDQITDDPVVTVGDILGEMTTVATLRIQVYRAKPTNYTDIKDKLLKLLLIQSHGRLLSSGCPLDEHLLSHICRGESSSSHPEPSEECRRKFDQWWASQLNSQHIQNTRSALYGIVAGNGFDRKSSLTPLHPEHVHPAMQTVQSQYPTQKTRMRTSFDPELELPKLQRWFADNQHPSRQQIQQYVKELNCLESRRGRKPLDVNNVVYWFKNARAAQKRAEIRNISPGLPCHINVNGYNSNSHSPPNGSGLLLSGDGYPQMKSSPAHDSYGRNPQMSVVSEELSMADSDLEEDDPSESRQRTDDEQPSSPSVPLSLTMSRKHEDIENHSPPPSPPPAHKIDSPVKHEVKEEPMDLQSTNNNSGESKINITDNNDDDDRSNDERKINSHDSTVVQEVPPHLTEMNNHHQLRSFSSPISEPDNSQLILRGPNDNFDRLAAGFPLVPNSMFSHSIMYMSHYIPGLHGHSNMTATSPPGSSGLSMSALAVSAAEERRKRNRTFIDPVTEVPRLEQWFSLNTHPSHNLILKYTEELNCMAYRQKFPRLEPKNVQFWFKNRRAKCKRLKMSLFDNPSTLGQYHHDRE